LALTGIQIKSAFFDKKQEGNNGFIFQIKIPYELGSKPIKKHILEPLEEISDDILDIQKDIGSLHQDICEALAENDKQELKEIEKEIANKQKKLKSLVQIKEKLQASAMKVLKNNIKNLPIEDLIVLTVIANNAINQELFEKGLKVLNSYADKYATKKSFIDYLNGIYYLGNLNYEKARRFLYKALHQEPYVVEIGIALILALSENYFKHKDEILKIVKTIEDNFDDDNYEGKNLQILYFHAGTIALANGDYPSALNFFKKAYDSLPFIVKHIPIPSIGFLANLNEVKNFFQMPIVISYKLMGKTKIAEELLNEILERCNKVPCKEECRQKYLTWYNNAEKRMELSKCN
jgi:tetratricopeptide (TPR) repeat protein